MNALDRYFDNLTDLLASIRKSQGPAMEKAARAMADCLAGGGLVYTFGTGHGHLLALEIFYRAGGPAGVRPILDERLMLHKSAAGSTLWERDEALAAKLLERYPVGRGDVLLVMSNSGRNAVPVLLARGARERGAVVVALTSMAHTSAVTPRNRENLRLFETADVVLDNGGVLGDAAISFPGGGMTGATSTAVGAAMLQAIVCRARELMEQSGAPADFFRSSNVDGGDEINERLVKAYAARIPGLE